MLMEVWVMRFRVKVVASSWMMLVTQKHASNCEGGREEKEREEIL